MKQDKLISALSNIESAKSIMEDLNNIFGILREADPKEIEAHQIANFCYVERARNCLPISK